MEFYTIETSTQNDKMIPNGVWNVRSSERGIVVEGVCKETAIRWAAKGNSGERI